MSDLVPQKPDDLMSELTRGLSETDKHELKKVAAREQIALDTKAREASLRHAASGAGIDRLIDQAERLQYGEKSSTFNVSGAFHGASGVTNIEVKRAGLNMTVLKWVAIVAVIAIVLRFLLG